MGYAEEECCDEHLPVFEMERHIKFLEMMYNCLPPNYQLQEVNHLVLAYFVICGLDILRALDHVDKAAIANWILSFQIHSKSIENEGRFNGFHGSRSSQFPLNACGVASYGGGHLASTYCALAILKIIGFGFSFVDSNSILSTMRGLQQVDGSFMPLDIGGETDIRFVFCAAAICFMLGSWSGMDRVRAKNYILNCQAPVQRQTAAGGFQGRSNKAADTCYAFWVGGVLRILGCHELVDRQILRLFLFSCQSEYGGMSKVPGVVPELYHSFYGFAALSLLEEPGLKPLNPELGVTLFLP